MENSYIPTQSSNPYAQTPKRKRGISQGTKRIGLIKNFIKRQSASAKEPIAGINPPGRRPKGVQDYARPR